MAVQATLPALEAEGDNRVKSHRPNASGFIMEDPLGEEKKNRCVWTEEEVEIFSKMYVKNPKDFVKIAMELEEKSVKDCVLRYYLSKKNTELKKKSKK